MQYIYMHVKSVCILITHRAVIWSKYISLNKTMKYNIFQRNLVGLLFNSLKCKQMLMKNVLIWENGILRLK